MANEKQLAILMQGVEVWNQWREENSDVKIDLTEAHLLFANLRYANLYKANLNNANLSYADLSHANLKNAKLSYAKLYKADLSYAKLYKANLFNANLVNVDLYKANLIEARLNHADLKLTSLDYVNLIEARLNHADLSNANLFAVTALSTDFTGAKLTGACLYSWSISGETKLDDIDCKYVYMKAKWNKEEQKYDFCDRLPATGEFAPGDFQKLFQQALNTVDLLFKNGIDWQAFFNSFQKLQTETGKELSIRAIETRYDGTFVVKLNVPLDADKAVVEEKIRKDYKLELEAQKEKHRAELKAKDDEIKDIYRQHNADLKELSIKQSTNIIEIVKYAAENMPRLNVGGDLNIESKDSTVNLGNIDGTVNNQHTSHNVNQTFNDPVTGAAGNVEGNQTIGDQNIDKLNQG